MSIRSIRRVAYLLSAVLSGVSGKNISDYLKRNLASGSKKGNVNEAAIIDLSSGSTLFWENGTQTDSLNAVIEIIFYLCIQLFRFIYIYDSLSNRYAVRNLI